MTSPAPGASFEDLVAALPDYVVELPLVLDLVGPEEVPSKGGGPGVCWRWRRGSRDVAIEVVPFPPDAPVVAEGRPWCGNAQTATSTATGSGGCGGGTRTFDEALSRAADFLLFHAPENIHRARRGAGRQGYPRRIAGG